MDIENKLQALKGKRIIWRGKSFMVKSAKKINAKYLFITDSKTMNLDKESANKFLSNIKILN